MPWLGCFGWYRRRCKMLLTYAELCRWSGMTLFEIWINCVGLFVYSVILALKLEGVCDFSWHIVFSPLFVSSGLNAYLTLIFFIRNVKLRLNKVIPVVKFCRSVFLVSSLFMFYLLASCKATGSSNIAYPLVLVPLYVVLLILMVRICHGTY